MESKKSHIKKDLYRKLVLSILFLQPLYGLIAQNRSYHFERENTEWVVFTDSKRLGVGLPSSHLIVIEEEDILYSDSLIKEYVTKRFSGGELPQQGIRSCPVILDSWDDYYRQVVIYFDEERSEDIFLFHYIHKNVIKNHDNWKQGWVFISGGCSNYWMARVSVKSRHVISFVIN